MAQRACGAAFRYDSRLNVVLLRDGWGQTPWTRVEEKAIQDRCLNDGWDRLIVVNIDRATRPKWIPEVNLFLDLAVFPIAQAAGAIKRQFQQIGGELHATSPFDAARRLATAGDFKTGTKEFFWSGVGVKAADESVAAIITTVGREAAGFGTEHEVAHGLQGGYGVVRMGSASALVSWQRAANTCHECDLEVRILDGKFETPQEQKQGRTFMRFERPRQLWQASFTVNRDPALGVCWMSGGKALTTDQVAAVVLEQLVRAATDQ